MRLETARHLPWCLGQNRSHGKQRAWIGTQSVFGLNSSTLFEVINILVLSLVNKSLITRVLFRLSRLAFFTSSSCRVRVNHGKWGKSIALFPYIVYNRSCYSMMFHRSDFHFALQCSNMPHVNVQNDLKVVVLSHSIITSAFWPININYSYTVQHNIITILYTTSKTMSVDIGSITSVTSHRSSKVELSTYCALSLFRKVNDFFGNIFCFHLKSNQRLYNLKKYLYVGLLYLVRVSLEHSEKPG